MSKRQKSKIPNDPLNIVFIHPDLGIGGAERLVVDAGIALVKRSHKVHFITSHHDPSHCFPETVDGTLPVTVVGDWLPRNIFGKFNAVFAYLRMILCAFWLIWFGDIPCDVVICDQVSACIPVLKLKRIKVVFYCHFPDQLLAKKASWLKDVYRTPINLLEEKTTGMADKVVVNSKFTDSVFQKTFTSLKSLPRDVLYPSLNFSEFNRYKPSASRHPSIPSSAESVFLSINRYEFKKNIQLALKAFDQLQYLLPSNLNLHESDDAPRLHLIIAGGYDDRVDENRDCHCALNILADDLKLSSHVTFLKSITNEDKLQLMNDCTALLYTPSEEHFGIVPLEAMYMTRPVIAVASGGPLETVINGETGFLCEPSPASFAEAMEKMVSREGLSKKLGEAGRAHVIRNFSFDAFSNQLENIIQDVTPG